MSFKDHFSRQSAAYSRYRPGYPPELIEWVASQAPDRRIAVDCATGSGQAALELSGRFETVVALDGSLSQLRHATVAPNVSYVAALAERLPLHDRSVSLVAAAQAAHWFDFERFHAECRRVLVAGGVVARMDLREVPPGRRRRRRHRRLLPERRGCVLARRAALRRAGLPDAAVSLARSGGPGVRARDPVGPGRGDRLRGVVVVGAALQGSISGGTRCRSCARRLESAWGACRPASPALADPPATRIRLSPL